MSKRGTQIAVILIAIVCANFGTFPNCFAQLLSAKAPETNFRWGLAPDSLQKLSRNVTAGPRISFPVQLHPTPEMIAAAKRQHPVMQNSGSLATGGSGSHALLTPGSPTLLGRSPNVSSPEHTESVHSGAATSGAAQPATGSTGSHGNIGVTPHLMPCLRPGVGDVIAADGSSGLIFLEPGKKYAIHGCGFGNQPGEAYLTGVKHAKSSSKVRSPEFLGMHARPDWIRLIPATGADPHQKQPWTDTEIQVVVDPNTSGFYDNYWGATIVVFPGGGKPEITSVAGIGFWAARVEQILTSLPLPLPAGSKNPKQQNPVSMAMVSWLAPAHVADNAGHPVQANLLSPSAASVVLPGHTFAVIREDNSSTFSGNEDALDVSPSLLNFTSGFQPETIQLFTSNLSPGLCPAGSNFSSSGKWNTALRNYAVPYQLVLSWQEQSCGHNGISAYAIDLTVAGPRGLPVFSQFP